MPPDSGTVVSAPILHVPGLGPATRPRGPRCGCRGSGRCRRGGSGRACAAVGDAGVAEAVDAAADDVLGVGDGEEGGEGEGEGEGCGCEMHFGWVGGRDGRLGEVVRCLGFCWVCPQRVGVWMILAGLRRAFGRFYTLSLAFRAGQIEAPIARTLRVAPKATRLIMLQYEDVFDRRDDAQDDIMSFPPWRPRAIERMLLAAVQVFPGYRHAASLDARAEFFCLKSSRRWRTLR